MAEDSNEELAGLIVTRRPAKEMADGTLRVQIDVEPNDRRTFLDMFPDNGDPICVVRLNPEAVKAHQQQTAFAEPEPEKPKKGEQGQFARWLVSSGFFRNPKVWQFCGSDDEFLEWLKKQSCAIGPIAGDRCDGDVVPAHVRRIASGAGTAKKPEYSAIAACNKHHLQQHQHGESHWFGDASEAKEWFDRQRIKHLEDWSREDFKLIAQVDSLTKLTPQHVEFMLSDPDIGITLNIPQEFF